MHRRQFIHTVMGLGAASATFPSLFAGERDKDKIKAWWFDSPYSLDLRGPHNSVTTDMTGFQSPWERFITDGLADRCHCFRPQWASAFDARLWTREHDSPGV